MIQDEEIVETNGINLEVVRRLKTSSDFIEFLKVIEDNLAADRECLEDVPVDKLQWTQGRVSAWKEVFSMFEENE